MIYVLLVFYWVRLEISSENRYILLLSTAFRSSSCKFTQLSAQFAKKLFGEAERENRAVASQLSGQCPLYLYFSSVAMPTVSVL